MNTERRIEEFWCLILVVYTQQTCQRMGIRGLSDGDLARIAWDFHQALATRRVASDPVLYLQAALRNARNDQWRQQKRWDKSSESVAQTSKGEDNPSTTAEDRDTLAACLSLMSPTERTVVLLHFEGHSFKTIKRRTGVSESTAWRMKEDVIRRLRERFSGRALPLASASDDDNRTPPSAPAAMPRSRTIASEPCVGRIAA